MAYEQQKWRFNLQAHTFYLDKPFSYNFTGKFEAPNPEWVHLTRELSDYELIIVTKGVLYIADEKHKYTVHEGEYLLMGPVPLQHGYQASDCTFYWLHFGCNNGHNDAPVQTLDSYPIKESGPLHFTIPVQGKLPTPDRIIVLLKNLQDSVRRYHNPVTNNCLTTAAICEVYNQLNSVQSSESTKSGEQLYHDIIDYISYHICENLKVGDIAEYFGYNEKYLTTFFNRMAGMPLKKYLTQELMARAAAQLSDTNISISQIAYSIGFVDPHNFSNAFKKNMGMSPTEYRNSYSKRLLFHE